MAGWKNEENETQWRIANPSMVHSWAAYHWSSWSSACLGTHWGAMKSVPQLKDRKLGICPLTPMSHWLRVALGIVNTPQHPGCAGPGLSGHRWPGEKPGSRTAAERHQSGSYVLTVSCPPLHLWSQVTEATGRALKTPAISKYISLSELSPHFCSMFINNSKPGRQAYHI